MLRRDIKNFALFAGGSQSTGRQSPVLQFKRPQPQSTRVEAFTHDDFSDLEDNWDWYAHAPINPGKCQV